VAIEEALSCLRDRTRSLRRPIQGLVSRLFWLSGFGVLEAIELVRLVSS
jgi:hypothetical protein